MLDLFLVRHAESQNDVDTEHCLSDPFLTECGNWQAHRISVWLAEKLDSLDKAICVYSSPAIRAMETAFQIDNFVKTGVIAMPNLAERDIIGGEGWESCYGRAEIVLDWIYTTAYSFDGCLVLVSHCDLINALINLIVGGKGKGVFFHHDNTGITHISFYAGAATEVMKVNSTQHLD
jgi:broad specificity phosphatase PhoE